MDEPDTDDHCTAWRLFRDHGDGAERVIEAALARCLKAADHAGADSWRRVAVALAEWRN
ncbi:MAG: hypothetical protein WDO24_15380 [Pseudomonadota bacterium]